MGCRRKRTTGREHLVILGPSWRARVHEIIWKTQNSLYVNLKIDLGITPAKSMKFIAKWASIIAGRECVLRYAIMKTAPIADAIITAWRPRLQWIKPKATDESITINNVFLVYLLMNLCKKPRKTSSSHIPTINSPNVRSIQFQTGLKISGIPPIDG